LQEEACPERQDLYRPSTRTHGFCSLPHWHPHRSISRVSVVRREVEDSTFFGGMLQRVKVDFAVTNGHAGAENPGASQRRRRGRSQGGGTSPAPRSKSKQRGTRRKKPQQSKSRKAGEEPHSQSHSLFPREETEGRVFFKPFPQASPIRTKSSSGNLHHAPGGDGAGANTAAGVVEDVPLGGSAPAVGTQVDLSGRPVPRLPHHRKLAAAAVIAEGKPCVCALPVIIIPLFPFPLPGTPRPRFKFCPTLFSNTFV